MVLIGITGKAQTGKDTVARFFVEQYKFEQFSFACALKSFCLNLFCLSSHQLNTHEGKSRVDKRYKKTPREILQQTGEALRNVYKDIWVEQLDRKIVGHPRVVVSDVRYRNEAEFIKNKGGFLLKLVRSDFSIDGDAAKHVSETELDTIDDLVDFIITAKSGEVDKLYVVSRTFIDSVMNNSKFGVKV